METPIELAINILEINLRVQKSNYERAQEGLDEVRER